MSQGAPGTIARWQAAWRAAPSRRVALRYFAEYTALRLWGLLIGCFPIEANLATARQLGRIWWLLMKRHRERALDNLRHAFGERYSEKELERIARRSFEHFAQLYLVELVMTPRTVNEWSWARYVELDNLGPALRELLTERGTIMLTAHFGNYELLGYTIAKLGLPIVAVMRPLDNPLINDYLLGSREVGGLSLLFKKGVTRSAEDVLKAGGTLCFIADQDAGRKGVFADFFGRKASWYKSIGLLAMQRRVPLVVGHAARQQRGFRYRMAIERIIQPEEWEHQDDPLRWITATFAHALETAIRRHPEQYLWMHRRWKSRPRDERSQPPHESPAATGPPA
ncbi:MAG: lipid A biosynthesis acyltransferase [Planctomycetes bacterium]|nr:lipid A biosynthesis acyltransferase [Planctomycetota bacterium]